MKVTFLMPRYERGPGGGYKVVCEHANQLAARGHSVTIVHPRELEPAWPRGPFSLRACLREQKTKFINRFSIPRLDWQPIHQRVDLAYVPSSLPSCIPDGDAIFATAWGTVQSVLNCPPSKGKKCYLIQGYETWQGPKDSVDSTWHAPMHKVVVSKWLIEIGRGLDCGDLAYVPNGIAQDFYRVTRPIESRPVQVAMAFSNAEVKGPWDGIEAIEIAKAKFPSLKVVTFGTGRRAPRIPDWIEYHRNPPQRFLVEEIYNGSSIFLSSSRSEGFALPPAEAACCGCAVVASDSGGIRDFIQQGKNGLLSPAKNPAALAKNLCLLLGNDRQRVELANAGRVGMQKFTWERSGDLLEKFLLNVIQNGRQPVKFEGPQEEYCAAK